MNCKRWIFLALIGILGLQGKAFGDACTSVFPGALQSNTSAKTISFTCGSQVQTNPSNILPTTNVNNPGGCGTNTCPTANCSASGTPVATMDPGPFQVSSGVANLNFNTTGTIDGNNNTTTDYHDITVQPGATLNFSPNPTGTTVYRIHNLTLKNGANVNFQAGDYWIDTLSLSGGQTITIGSLGTARIFLKSNLNSTKNLNIGTSADQFLIYGYGNLSFTGNTTIYGFLYSQGNITLGNTDLTGGATGQNITVNNSSHINYDSAALNNLDFGFICPSATNFNVSAPATGSFCQNTTVTITARDALNQTVTGYTRAITIDTQSGKGTWVSTTGGGTFSGNVNNGIATYQYVVGDSGVASFQLSYPSNGATPITIKAYQTNNPGILGLSGPVNFNPASLLVTDVAVPNPPTAPPPAFSTPQTAGNNFTLYLTAYNPSNCGIVTSYTGVKTIRFYTTYVDPTSGTINATINGTAIASSAGASQTTQAITFTNGVATVTGKYNDAGKLTLNVSDIAAGGPAGASGNFVVKPAQFAINIPGNTATQTVAPPAAAISACLADAVFVKAGAPFTVNVQAQNSAGNVTPNYGNEIANQGILLQSAALLAPNPGQNGSANNGAIGNGSTFTKITGSSGPFAQAPYFTGSTFSFDEVGCINLTASVGTGSYLGAGNVSNSTVVGRFIPDHFDASANTPQFTTGCSGGSGSFTYLDKSFVYGTQPILTVIARALAGTTTQNYTGSFWKLTSTGFGTVYNKAYFPVNVGDTIPALNLSATIPVPTFADGGSGSSTFTFTDGGGLKIQRLSGTLAPAFTAEIQLRVATITDSDGVACTGTGCTTGGFSFGNTTAGNGITFSGTGGGKQFYHGRLILVDAAGSEILPLVVPMQAQFYTVANGFVLNTLDSCTSYTGGATNLNVTPSAGLSTTASMPGTPTLAQGSINITLSAPSTTGYADIEANLNAGGANLPWLQYNWPYSGAAGTNFTANPRGRGNFGVFKGSDRIIYEKENYQ